MPSYLMNREELMTRMFDKKLIAGATAGAVMAFGAAGIASAETDTVKMAQQFGLLYVPLACF